MYLFNLKKVSVLALAMIIAMAGRANRIKTTITCKVINNNGSAVALFKVENGEAVRLGFRRAGIKDTCQFSISIEKEGIYYLDRAGSRNPNFTNVIYLKPGENKSVDFYLGMQGDSCKVNNANQETIVLKKWINSFNAICQVGFSRSGREHFFNAYEDFVQQAEQFKKENLTANKYFNHLYVSKINTEIDYVKAAAFFYFTERMNSQYDSSATHKSFYQSLTGLKFCDAGLLHSEHGLQLLNYWLGYKQFQKFGNKDQMLATPFLEKAKDICNDTVRGAFALEHMRNITSHEVLLADMEPVKHSFVTPEMKEAYRKKQQQYSVYAKGSPAYNFSLTDTNDKLVSLADFKGKVVVVDVWAMWCGPCLSEKPFYQQVEEEFKDRNDIVFLGISVDGISRKEVWKKFVARKGWKNPELISDFDDSIMKYYKIDGIPRFMIFDKEGKILAVDAPRPSTGELKRLIEKTLKIEDRAANP